MNFIVFLYIELSHFVTQFHFAQNSFELWLVHQGLEPPFTIDIPV